MKFVISKHEREIIERFKLSKYPSIYKTDRTDNILFLELVDFDVCSYLLKERMINNDQYEHILNEYQTYLMNVNTDHFDEYALNHYKNIVQIMDIFKKYYDN
ncbi:MAG: hypothetical protein E7679_00060 [Ruminococcaceae bacterium]|nr:hypothetical protein [Oscillospiraceae bacterium]